MDRRNFLRNSAVGIAASNLRTSDLSAAPSDDVQSLYKEIEKGHDRAVKRLQDWIKQPSIAAEDRGMAEGCEMMMTLLKEVGFDHVTKVPTDRHPGVFATLDAGAPKTVGVYFMYDVKQVDPSEWSSPPFEAALIDKPNLGKCLVGRGAVNSKGPESALLFALSAIKSCREKDLP